jgi:hypothetical protein
MQILTIDEFNSYALYGPCFSILFGNRGWEGNPKHLCPLLLKGIMILIFLGGCV